MWVFNTRFRRNVLFSIILYYPIMSLIFGTPIPFAELVQQAAGTHAPFPLSLFELDSSTMAVFQFVSLLITIIGGIATIVFSMRTEASNKAKEQNAKMDKIDEKIDEAVIAFHQEIKELRNELKQMESRICDAASKKDAKMEKDMDDKINRIEKEIQEKVATAKNLEDERIGNINHRLNKLEVNRSG